MVARDNLVTVTPRTVHQVLEESAAQYGDAPALRRIDGTTLSWRQYRDAALEIAAGLRALGLRNGDVVALHSETRLEFYLADLGILANGSIAAALYPTYPVPDLLRSIAGAGARAVFAEDPRALTALRSGSPTPTSVEHWFLLTGTAPGAESLDNLRARGRAAIATGATRAEVQPTDPAILYLTSGATGEPKMALVTHQAILANLDMGPEALRLSPKDSMIAFLPSAHIAQRIVVELLPIRCGTPVTFSESLMKLPQEIRSTRPTVLLAPRMWERIYSTICTELRKRPAAARKLFYGSLGMALAAARYRREGKPVPMRLRAPLRVADRLLFRKIRARFGGRLRVAASGAAPLAKNLAEFYDAIGMPLIEGYGLTEGGVVTLNPLDAPRAGSIGKPLAGVEVRIGDNGELLVRTPCLFSGYWRDPPATAEVVSDGWLHTGDIAQTDDAGYVYITGRKTEVIVSSTGKKIFPARVEALFKIEPLISQVLLLGDRLPYLVALFTINPTAALGLPGMQEWSGRPASELSDAPPVVAEIQKAVARANAQLAAFEQVRKYRILTRDFSIEEGELTATMKVRRTRAIENFKTEIEALYAGRD